VGWAAAQGPQNHGVHLKSFSSHQVASGQLNSLPTSWNRWSVINRIWLNSFPYFKSPRPKQPNAISIIQYSFWSAPYRHTCHLGRCQLHTYDHHVCCTCTPPHTPSLVTATAACTYICIPGRRFSKHCPLRLG
jgi:hypothetical protein